jgi:hypothetical protein
MKNEYVNLVEQTLEEGWLADFKQKVKDFSWEKFKKEKKQKLKETFHKFLNEVYHENKAAFKTIVRFAKDKNSVSKEELKEVGDQLADNFKLITLVGITAPPGGGAVLIGIIWLANKFKIDLEKFKPSSFKKEKDEEEREPVIANG